LRKEENKDQINKSHKKKNCVYNIVVTESLTFADMDSRQKMQRASLYSPLTKHHNTVCRFLLDENKSSCAAQLPIPGTSFPAPEVQSSRSAWMTTSYNIYYQNKIHSSIQPRLSCFAGPTENTYA